MVPFYEEAKVNKSVIAFKSIKGEIPSYLCERLTLKEGYSFWASIQLITNVNIV